MAGQCKKIKYVKKRRSSKPVVRSKKITPPPQTSSDQSFADSAEPSVFLYGEGDLELENINFELPRNTIEELRKWVEKQRFIPQDLTDEFLSGFLSGVGYDVEAASEKLHNYFYSRQEPSSLFRGRDPLSPENAELLRKLYVIPMPDTTVDGKKIILMGLLKQVAEYSLLEHAKILAMVFDLLIWEKDFGYGDFVVVFDGRGFECPQLLEKTVKNHRSITSMLLDTIPGTLRSFYLLYPPSHVANVADNRNGIWITVVKSKQEMISYLPADILPLEFGGNLGHLEDLLEQWNQHLEQCRDFFIHFESRMINDLRRRMCHEREMKEGGRGWISRMKLEADEWEYKIQYYEKMKNMKPLEHPGFGADRIEKMKQKKKMVAIDFLEKCKKLVKEQKEADMVFEPTYLYHGYAPEIRKAKLEAEKDKLRKKLEQICLPEERNKLGQSCLPEEFFLEIPNCQNLN